MRVRELAAAAILFCLGCEVKEVELERSSERIIPGGPAGVELEMMELEPESIVFSEIEDPGIGPEDITGASITRMTIEVLEPEGADLAFADAVEVFAESGDLPRVRIAHQDRFPTGDALVQFEVDDVDLREYLVSDGMRMIAVFEGGGPERDIRVRGTTDLRVGITVRGACAAMKR